MIATGLALFPWEDIDMAVREQAEQEIWSDAEYQQWLDTLLAEPGCAKCGYTGEEWQEGTCGGEGWTGKPCPHCSDPTAGMSELGFMEYTFQQLTAQIPEKMLSFADVMLRAPRTGGWDLLPEWQRDDYVGA